MKVEFVKGGKILSMCPWKISAMTLRHFHGLICKRFNNDTATKVRAVISVPAFSTHFQCAETMRAGATGASR